MSPFALASSFAAFAGSGWVVRRAAAWIEAQRAAHRPLAAAIDPGAVGRLAPWFDGSTLATVRVRAVPRLEPPAGFGLLGRLQPFGLDFDRVLAITFVDTIVVADAEAARLPTLFHECVHVVQFRLLGVAEFARLYLGGWAAAGCRYDAIPLERDAYELQRRFSANPAERFSVEAEVRRSAASAQYG